MSVVVIPYDEKWKSAFEEIKAEIENVIGDLIVGIEHVGSTSVEGLSAKPCIDIDVIIKDYSVFNDVVDKLATIGYIHKGNLGIKTERRLNMLINHIYKNIICMCVRNNPKSYIVILLSEIFCAKIPKLRDYMVRLKKLQHNYFLMTLINTSNINHHILKNYIGCVA